jgi:hypothetical protein
VLYQLSYLPLAFMYVCNDNAVGSICQQAEIGAGIENIIAQVWVTTQES